MIFNFLSQIFRKSSPKTNSRRVSFSTLANLLFPFISGRRSQTDHEPEGVRPLLAVRLPERDPDSVHQGVQPRGLRVQSGILFLLGQGKPYLCDFLARISTY